MHRSQMAAEGVEAFVVVAGPRQGAMEVDSVWPLPSQAKARASMLRVECRGWFYLGPANDYQGAEVVPDGIERGAPVRGTAAELWGCPVAWALTACDACGVFPVDPFVECDPCRMDAACADD